MTRPQNDTFLKALLREPTPYTPIWLMRQAGRYLPEYNQTRARAGDFISLCQNSQLATEVALQPLERYDLDAAIVFSDILTIPDAMGLGLYFSRGEGPRFERPLRDERDFKNLYVPDPTVELRYVLDTVALTRSALNNRIPLIGFSGSPFTLACYMIEGQSGTDFERVKKLIYQRPDLMHTLLEKNTKAIIDYLNAQIDYGAQAVMVFDTWGGILAHQSYLEFSLQYMKMIFSALKRESQGQVVPRIMFTKGGSPWLEAMADSGTDAVGLDWTVDLGQARTRIGNRVALQGNIDPSILLSSPEVIERETKNALASFGYIYGAAGHVFNLGHGIDKNTPPENVSALVETVKKHSRTYHCA